MLIPFLCLLRRNYHRRMDPGAGGGCNGNLDFLGGKRNLGKANFSRSLHVCVSLVFLFSKRDISSSILN